MTKKKETCDFCTVPCKNSHCYTNENKIKIKKENLPKTRKPIAPPSKRHKSKKDYDRKKEKEKVRKNDNLYGE
jgi:hypothetical protein